MQANPFTSHTYTSIWNKYFGITKTHNLRGLKNLSFFKVKYLPLFVNIGKNLTKGMSYNFDKDYQFPQIGNKVYLIHDVPEYFNLETHQHPRFKIKRVRQYKGFLADLEGFNSLEEFMSSRYNSKARYKYRRNIKRLESCFDIKYENYFGAISKEEYQKLFDVFLELLEKRFSKKREKYDQLSHWKFYKALIYQMILEKKASLFVIKHHETPISIMMNFHSNDTVFNAIPVFDIAYAKFTLGYTNIMKVIEWCIANNIRFFDFSKGDYDYKARWGNKAYNFEYHIMYNPKSVISNVLAFGIEKYFALKQIMREKDFNKLYHNTIYRLNPKSKKEKNIRIEVSEIDKIDTRKTSNSIEKTIIKSIEYVELREIIYNNLFENKVHINNVALYPLKDENNFYLELENKKLSIAIEYN